MNAIKSNLGDKTRPDEIDPSELVDANEAARMLHQKPQTLAAWRSEGRGPEYVKVGRSVKYQPQKLRQYLAACVVVPGAA